LPNLLIVGAAKAGTTSLHRYLDLHPEIFMSRIKELQLFHRDDWRERLGWYREQFPTAAAVRGEASPVYSMHPWFPSVPERIRETIPDARIVYLVRDPVERLVAQYVEFYALRLEDRSLEEALADYDSPSNRFVMASRYAYQLDRFREFFPDSQIVAIDQRELLEERAATLRRLFQLLGVDPEFTSPEFERRHNEREAKMRAKPQGVWMHRRGLLRHARERTRVLPEPIRERLKLLVADPVETPELDPGLRAELEACLREDAGRLREYTGKPLAHWSV
jgi:hypothetical protein